MFKGFMLKERQVLWGFAFFLFLIFIDQATKKIASHIFRNYDFAFSLQAPIALMYAVYFVGIFGIILYLKEQYAAISRVNFLAWILILSGAISNVGERLFLSYVRDWIYFYNGVFNLADGYIILGVLVLLLTSKSESRNPKNV